MKRKNDMNVSEHSCVLHDVKCNRCDSFWGVYGVSEKDEDGKYIYKDKGTADRYISETKDKKETVLALLMLCYMFI